jgi:valyl-tRNA synthetase
MLDQIVRLLHPFLPFVTEEIAEQFGAAPLLQQQHPRRDDVQLAPDDEKGIGELQAAVDALRRFRAETEIPPGKVLAAVFVGDGAGAAGRYAPYAGAFRALARTEVAFEGEPEADATVVLVPGGRLEVAAAVDKAEEVARLEQLLAKAEAEVERGEAKLGNEKFVGRAPEAVVAKEHEKLAGHVAERDGLAARLAQLRDA